MANRVWLPSMIALLMICAVALTGCDVSRAVDEAGRMLESLTQEKEPPKAEIDWDRYRRPYIPLKDEELEARIREFYRAAFGRELESVNCSGSDSLRRGIFAGLMTRLCTASDPDLEASVEFEVCVSSGDILSCLRPYRQWYEGHVISSDEAFQRLIPALRFLHQPEVITSYFVIPRHGPFPDERIFGWEFNRVIEHEGVPCVYRHFSAEVCAVTGQPRTVFFNKPAIPQEKDIQLDKEAALRIATARLAEGTGKRWKHLRYEVVQDVERVILTITPAYPPSLPPLVGPKVDLIELGYSPFDVFYTWAVPVLITNLRNGWQQEPRVYIDTKTGIVVKSGLPVPPFWLPRAGRESNYRLPELGYGADSRLSVSLSDRAPGSS